METLIENKTFADAEINHLLTPEKKIDLLRQMFRIRRFELTALKQYQTSGQMGGFLHLYTGQESVAVGTLSLCGDDDHVIAGYRSHGNALAMGMSMNECMAELFGKVTGCSKGKGGSMHFFAPDKNYWGGHGIVAGQTPLGMGLAFALKYQGRKGCCLCFSATARSIKGFIRHPEPGLALEIPVIYIIENNQYSMGTSLERLPPTKPASPPGPKVTTSNGTGLTAKIFTKFAPKLGPPSSAPITNAGPRCWKLTPIVTTVIPCRMPTRKNIATPRRSKNIGSSMIHFNSGRHDCWPRASSRNRRLASWMPPPRPKPSQPLSLPRRARCRNRRIFFPMFIMRWISKPRRAGPGNIFSTINPDFTDYYPCPRSPIVKP